MDLLPGKLRDALKRAPRLVVAPVAAGYGQEALVRWAERQGRDVIRDPAELTALPTLLVCARRSRLTEIPRDLPLDDMLVLDEADALFDRSEWEAALNGSASGYSEATFEQCEGWPLGLDIVMRISARRISAMRIGATRIGERRIGDRDQPLHLHPLAVLALERLLPEGPERMALVRCAATPLLLPDLHGRLGISRQEASDLLDAGFLRPVSGGLALPRLLRLHLRPQVEEELALTIARALASRRQLDEALTALAEAELWKEYLELLAEEFEPAANEGEARLRRLLYPLPRSAHACGEYHYLVGSLERLRGDLDRALERYAAARKLASGELRARVDNARGIALALQGKLESARRAFGAAAKGAAVGAHGGARLEGEARHNRAGVSIQQGRFAEAEKDLRSAVANFREAADYVREARSLQLLALSWHRRGLLDEAWKGYGEALELLATLGQPTALLRTNLAEVLVIMGHAAEARAQLEQAATEARHDARARGYVEANLALWSLVQGQTETAAQGVRALLRREGLEAHLRAEAELLLARALRQQGNVAEAREHAEAAGPVGVAARLELALCRDADLSEVIEQARAEEARFELATALLNRAGPGDLEEALALIRTHGYRILLDSPRHAPALAALAEQDPATTQLFPLRMTTFGGFRLRFLGHSLTLAEFPTRKSAALLLRLALASRPLAREALAEEFWGDTGNPVHSLQTALYHLNRTLNAQVVGGRKGTLELIYPVDLDLTGFERAAVEALEGAWSQSPDGVRRALALAEGEALAEFPEWFDEERRRSEALRVRLWRRLAELETAEPQRAAEALEALLRLDPYDAAAHRGLIALYAELGEPDLARRQEERLRLIEREL
jgi:Tfp pilus assembly protein PilF